MTDTTECLGLREVIALGMGGMIGGEFFSIPGLAMPRAGHATHPVLRQARHDRPVLRRRDLTHVTRGANPWDA